MKAIVHDAYGPPDVLRLEEVPAPEPRDGEVLVPIAIEIGRARRAGILPAEDEPPRSLEGRPR